MDTSGADCMVGQRDPIWFLSGIFPGGTALRTCAVPAGEWLFFPVINSVQINARGVCGQTGSLNVAQLWNLAGPLIDAASNLQVTPDGKAVKGLIRVKSAPFATTFPLDNIFNDPCGGPGTVPGGVYSPSVETDTTSSSSLSAPAVTNCLSKPKAAAAFSSIAGTS